MSRNETTDVRAISLFLAALSALVVFAGCNAFLEDRGGDGEPCFDNKKCLHGLECSSGFKCVSRDAGTGADTGQDAAYDGGLRDAGADAGLDSGSDTGAAGSGDAASVDTGIADTGDAGSCDNECQQQGRFECLDQTKYEHCADSDGDGCLELIRASCGAGSICENHQCMPTTCEAAARERSHLGCEFWPTVTRNAEMPAGGSGGQYFHFGVVTVNPQSISASLTVYRGGSVTDFAIVPPGGTHTFLLPWIDELKGTTGSLTSVSMQDGAFRLVSDVPVSAQQLNSYEDEVQVVFDGGLDGSYTVQYWSGTRDATLLLPTHALSIRYHAVSYQSSIFGVKDFAVTKVVGRNPSFFALVGTQDGTTVVIDFPCFTLPGTGIRTYGPGSTDQFLIGAGQVLQIGAAVPESCGNWEGSDPYFCNFGPQWDVTGTHVESDKPVVMFAGHDCGFVPYNVASCDHFEEQMLPIAAWGKHYVMTHSATTQNPSESNLYRVLSGSASNKIVLDFSPPASPVEVELGEGEWKDFVTSQDFEVRGAGAFAVAQFMTGSDGAEVGDPSLAIGVPVEQYRRHYVFFVPSTFPESYVNITAPSGSSVTLDGQAVTGFTPVGGRNRGYDVAREPLAPGLHSIDSGTPVGAMVYGYGFYSSYMSPAGLNLLEINK